MSNSLTLGFLGVLSLNVSVFRLVIVPFTAILLVWVLRGYAFIPLKHLPGPWFTRLFSLRDRSGRPVHGKQLLNLHQKYGTHCLFWSVQLTYQDPLFVLVPILSLFKATKSSRPFTALPQNGRNLNQYGL